MLVCVGASGNPHAMFSKLAGMRRTTWKHNNVEPPSMQRSSMHAVVCRSKQKYNHNVQWARRHAQRHAGTHGSTHRPVNQSSVHRRELWKDVAAQLAPHVYQRASLLATVYTYTLKTCIERCRTAWPDPRRIQQHIKLPI